MKEIDEWVKKAARMCFEKPRYRLDSHAYTAITMIIKKRPAKLRPYHCPICYGYHLTKLPDRGIQC